MWIFHPFFCVTSEECCVIMKGRLLAKLINLIPSTLSLLHAFVTNHHMFPDWTSWSFYVTYIYFERIVSLLQESLTSCTKASNPETNFNVESFNETTNCTLSLIGWGDSSGPWRQIEQIPVQQELEPPQVQIIHIQHLLSMVVVEVKMKEGLLWSTCQPSYAYR